MKPYNECPSFNHCNCNICPLDPESDEKSHLSGDEKCKAEKPTRFRIGQKYSNLLPYQGLTKREWVGRKNWEGLSPENKELKLQALAKTRKSLNCPAKKAFPNDLPVLP